MKLFKSFLAVLSCLALTACQPNEPVQETMETAVSVTSETTAAVETQPVVLGFYDKYPELSEYDIFASCYEQAEAIVNTMTVAQKVGQLFWLRCPDDQETALATISAYYPGGFVLFGNHFEDSTPYSIQLMNTAFQEESPIPMAISCDEEGGDVVRISQYPQFRNTPYASPQVIYQLGGLEEIKRDCKEKSDFLRNLGINVNLAPVADVSENSYDYMYSRAFGKNASDTGKYIEVCVRAYNESRMTCVLKHFPGYGSNRDTHDEVVRDIREYDEFKTKDFLPFVEGIKTNAPVIMVNHNIVECMDTDNPASISAEVHNVLRSSLGFTGLIMTDDLGMSAITDSYNELDACLNAIYAGNDIICTSNYSSAIPAIVKAAETGMISEERLNTSVIRIIAWKLSYGIIRIIQ